mgnify:CR=1 FL=1
MAKFYSRTPINTVRVNSDIIKNELQKRNLTCADVAKEMGHSEKYISNKLVDNIGFISQGDAKFLSAIYNIPLELYEYKESESETSVEDGADSENKAVNNLHARIYITDDDWSRIYEVINKAVYEGVKRAWENS